LSMAELRKATPPAPPPDPGLLAAEPLLLRAERDRLLAILDGISDPIVVRTARGRIVYANLAAARRCGYPDAHRLLAARGPDVLARFELFDADGRPLSARKRPLRRVLRGELPFAEALLRYRPNGNGEERWSMVRTTPLADARGRIRMAVSVYRDVTDERRVLDERRRMLAELAAERARLEAVLRHLPSGVLIADAATGKIVIGNARLEEILGRPLRSADGADDEAGMGPPVGTALLRALSRGDTVRREDIEF